MAFAEDLSGFFSLADFAETVTVGGASVPAIFDNAYGETLEVAGTQPRLTCRTSDVAATTTGTAVTVRGVSYVVRNIEPDGTGVTTLILERS